ncbi:MAG: hypothetical protein QOH75_273 [Actinomycetota bacterium]|jgi:hypothetical protein|nr:hypothetical protein [Actinomycetota bacterium]MDQ1670320.1 hypothetical protein [Actinomycetota bacterium]
MAERPSGRQVQIVTRRPQLPVPLDLRTPSGRRLPY